MGSPKGCLEKKKEDTLTLSGVTLQRQIIQNPGYSHTRQTIHP